MNRIKLMIIMAGALAMIVAILLYNKSQMAAKSRNDALTAVPVTVVTVSSGPVRSAESLVGTVSGNSDVSIISETQGRVVAVLAEVGEEKAAGAALVQVDDELKKASSAAAEVNYEKAKRDLERFEKLAQEQAATPQQVEAARLGFKAAESQFISARREYRDTKITTPIAGVVTSRPVDVGTYVQKGMPVANVVDIARLKVKLNVAEQDVFRLKAGDRVEITTDVYPGTVFEGFIRTISAKADEGHTYPVEVRLANSKEHPLRAGMFCRVSFTTLSAGGDMPAIPREALVGSLKKPQVYVVEGAVAHLRDLVIGGNALGSRLVVLQGVKTGEHIVVNGQNNLKDGAAVTLLR